MEKIWDVSLFGGLEATWNLQPLRFATRKTAAVFAFLAYHRGRAFSRDGLAETFWPENDTEAARNSLRVALSHLRKHIEPEGVPPGSILSANRTTVSLAPLAISTDVVQFHNALTLEAAAPDPAARIPHLLTAIDLYRGPLLQGCYDEWIYPEQAQLAETYAAALGRLTDLLLASGERERAVEFARRAVQAEPLREANHCRLIEVYAVTGRHDAALQQYRELERLFQKELNAEPARTTRDLIERIQQDRQKVVSPLAPRTPDPQPASVPQWFTSFCGREAELRHLQDALRERQPGEPQSHLLTLVGPGGIGKTRLVMEAATRFWQTEFAGRVSIVELSEITSYAQFPSTLASALGVTIPQDANPMVALTSTLSNSALLILDGVDPLMEGAVSAIHALRNALPRLTLIVTARQPLGLSGERMIAVPPLPVAPPQRAIAPEELAGWPGIQLFLDRARAVRPGFPLTAENAPALAALIARLDGLPLAIELAAAWVNLLTPDEILKRLDARFDLLVSQNHTMPLRHRSLRAVMDETCRLLPENAAACLACLSVFRGGWTVEAAQYLCKDSPVLEYLSVLQQRSLILSAEVAGGARFRMLETVREYARSLISPEAYERYQRLHASFFVTIAERLGPQINCPKTEPILAQLDAEQENFRTALQRCLGTLKEPLSALRLGASLWRFWYRRGLAEAGSKDLREALERAGPDTPIGIRLAALEGAGRFASSLGHFTRACGLFREGLERAMADRGSNRERETTFASDLAVAAKASGDFATTREAFKILLALKTREQDYWGMAYALSEIAEASDALRELGAAQEKREEARRLLLLLAHSSEESKFLGAMSEEKIAQSLMRVGFLASEQGDHTTAIPLLEDALASFRRAGNSGGIAIALERLGLAAFRCKEWDRARNALEEALMQRRGGVGPECAAFSLRLLTEIARQTGDSFSLKHLLHTGVASADSSEPRN